MSQAVEVKQEENLLALQPVMGVNSPALLLVNRALVNNMVRGVIAGLRA